MRLLVQLFQQSRLSLILGFILSLYLVISSSATTIQAQTRNSLSLTISPPVMYLTLRPGEKYTHIINLHYQGQEPVEVQPQMVDFTPSESGQGIDLEQNHTFPYLDTTAINLFQQPLTLEPNQTTSFKIPISIPSSALTKEYHLTVLFSTNPNQPVSNADIQADIAGTIGSNFILLINSDNRDLSQLSIKSIQGNKLVDSFGQISLKVIAANTGATASVASGSAILKDGRGNSVQTLDIFPDVILANSQRQLRFLPSSTESTSNNSNDSADTQTPTPLDQFTYDAPVLIGPYSLEVTLLDSNQVVRTTATYQVWAVPLAGIIIILIGTFILISYKLGIKKLPIGNRFKTY